MLTLKSIFVKSIDWVKEHHREIMLFILAFLISTISFGFGYLLRGDLARAPIITEKNYK